MPVSPNIGQSYAEEIAVLYRDAELRILARIAAALKVGIDSPTWEQDALARAQRVRAQAVAELNRTNPKVAAAITAAVDDAYAVGGATMLRDIGQAVGALDVIPPARIAAVRAITADIGEGLTSAQPAILRRVDDIFRDVVGRATSSTLAGGIGRLDAAQAAMVELAGHGIDSIPIGRGTMGMTDYLSMAVRTGTSRAAIEGSAATMLDAGVELCTIHPGPRSCEICDDWANVILTVDPGGTEGTYTFDAVDGSGPVEVDVAGSLDDARDDGWGHPNCRCAIAPYLPGVTEPTDRPPWDQEGYEAQQQQRQIERQIRNWKTRETIALDPAAQQQAADKVAAWQATQREHLRENAFLKRQSAREQIGRII